MYLVPDRFYPFSESTYEHDYDNDEEAEAALRKAGFEPRILVEDHSAEDGS